MGLLLVGCSNDFSAILDPGAGAPPGVGGAGPASASSDNAGGGPTTTGSGGAGVGAGESGGAPSGTGGMPSTGGSGGKTSEPECGNGVVEAGEVCDGGSSGSPYCTDACQVVCECPGNICTGSDTHAFQDPATGHCYYLSQTDAGDGHKSWNESEDWCITQWGGHLASLETEAEWQALQVTLPQAYSTEYLWLAAKEDNDWEWETGAGFVLDNHWASREPNMGPSDCLAMAIDGQLVDLGCNDGNGQAAGNHRICERAPVGAKQ